MTEAERTVLLQTKLNDVCLSIRPDSRLCNSYIKGPIGDEWCVDRVVRECCMMHWLYRYTNYQQRVYDAYRYFSYVFTDSRTVNDFVKNSVQPHIKAEIILSFGGIPHTWPWVSPVMNMSEKVDNIDGHENPEEVA